MSRAQKQFLCEFLMDVNVDLKYVDIRKYNLWTSCEWFVCSWFSSFCFINEVFGRQLIHHVSQYYRANQLFEHLLCFGIIVDYLCVVKLNIYLLYGIYQTFVLFISTYTLTTTLLSTSYIYYTDITLEVWILDLITDL